MADNERCDVTIGSRPCGKPASNWCYHTDDAKPHNHHVCDDHWDKKRKTCAAGQIARSPQAPAPAPAPQQRSRGDNAPPVRSI